MGKVFCIEVIGTFGVVGIVGVIGMSVGVGVGCKFFISDYIAFSLAYVLSKKDNRNRPERTGLFEKDIEKDAKRTAKRTS